jgi:hypothetical protein
MSAQDSESDDGFENMDVDKSRPGGVPEEPEETDDGQASTPQPLEEEEASTTDEEPKPPPIESSQERSNEPSDRPAAKTPSAPPPRRELPFVRRAQDGKQSQTQPRPTEDAEETAGETDDDELWPEVDGIGIGNGTSLVTWLLLILSRRAVLGTMYCNIWTVDLELQHYEIHVI